MSDKARNRFVELCDYLKTKLSFLQVNDENFDSEINNITPEPGGRHETVKGQHFSNFRYSGVIYIERLPGENIALATSMIRAWLDDHDDTRDKYNLETPRIETITLNKKYVDLLFSGEFIDEIYLTEVENGPIEWRGKTFDTVEYPYNVAEIGDVNGAPIIIE